nr:hypothetical protein [Tanacetum cinerariifolium]
MDTDTNENSDDDEDLDVEKKFDEFDNEIENIYIECESKIEHFKGIESEEDVFMLSMIFNVEVECEKLLTCNMDIGFINVLKYDTQRNHEYCKRRTHNFSGNSPFPKIEQFIEYISTIGEVKVPPDVIFKSFRIGEQNESQMDRREKGDWWFETITKKIRMKTITGGCIVKQLHQKLSVHTMDKLEHANKDATRQVLGKNLTYDL